MRRATEDVRPNSLRGKTTTHHIINRRDVTHGGRVARTGLDLFTAGEGLADTVVDKVVSMQHSIRGSIPTMTVRRTG